MKRLLSILILLTINHIECRVQKDLITDSELIEKYSVPLPIKTILDEHKEELFDAFKVCEPDVCIKKRRVYEFAWLPNYLIKTSLTRIRGAERARTIIQENDFNLIDIPNKYTYQVDNRVFIIVPKIHGLNNPKPLTLQQVKQLWNFILASGYRDLKKENYIHLKNNKLMIIDTEQRSFGRMFRGLSRLVENHTPYDFTEDAFTFVLQELADYSIKNIPQYIKDIPRNLVQKTGRESYQRIHEIFISFLILIPNIIIISTFN